ncbi:chorismate mutase [Acholeplasma vituli]|uniref:Chorismate mutase n=1 Tax=Paracholeplasma vituli TaxID=69473 RepID=A0ABT2PTT3_9MOLU|nr:chorismate mutase [Paracholeplasma vituli]MCU0104368.1 chorismate mutase [Paracholeplasma vituli]
MNKLEQARIIIDDVDQQIAELFKKRMHAVMDVLSHKIENHLPVLDSIREAQMIEKNLSRFNDDSLKAYYESFLKSILDISKAYQEDHYE